ncbi:MAG: rod shape-determining protein MreC [Bacteroidota bacterium]|jgi:rod shape-determining protein MreC|nr:rod shape-determining protein MreC [Cytophagales bacterium]MCE2956547.1 rod shape-determining protein MreC [Flammeovirgaceae bacterium]MCZ8069402.1 rod shape-determining protein MreC [Cytophagales bacterium]
MQRLFSFIYEYRAFFTFLLLELLCVWMVIENNQYQSTKYFNTSNSVAASIISTSQNIREYFSLRDINQRLAEENAELRRKVDQRNQMLYQLDLRPIKDAAIINRFDFIAAKVINNTTNNYKNFITIDKGKRHGLQPGMAAISEAGVVGKVKSVSDHYAVLISLLNIDNQVSSKIKRTGHFGTVQWDGVDPRVIDLKYIPRHVELKVGDTVVTSGYNAVFPEGILVGVVKNVKLNEEAQFHTIKVGLAQDFGKLAFVEVVKSNLKQEKDSLELKTIGEPK